MRITLNSKTYKDVTKNIITGNIATSISDHLGQFLLISNLPPSKNQMLNTDEKRLFRNIS